jgi:hypothetical protein
MTARRPDGIAGTWAVLALALFAAGCSNKGKYEGKVDVVVSDELKAMGVSLVDWRYTEPEKAFGIRLKSSKPVDRRLHIAITGPRIGELISPGPVGDDINKAEWMDFGGTIGLGNPFANFPESGTITIHFYDHLMAPRRQLVGQPGRS